MTLPNGADGVDYTLWGITGDPSGGDTTSADLVGWTQSYVTDSLKAQYVGTRGSGISVWTSDLGPLGILFAGITGGLPGLISALIERLFGLLGPLGGTLEDILGYVEEVPILGDLVTAIIGPIHGGGSGLTGPLGSLSSFFGDFLGILGSPTGLGSGSPGLPGLGSIPILGPIIQAITGSSSTNLSSWFTDLLGLFGHPTGLSSGTTTLPGLGSIPILGPIISAITGSSSTNLSNWFDDLLGIFGNPTGLSTGSPALPGSPTSIPILGALLSGSQLKTPLVPHLQDLWDGLFNSINQISATSPATGVDFNSVNLILRDLLSKLSPLPAPHLAGVAPMFTLGGVVPGSAVTSTSPNLLQQPGFNSRESIVAEQGWSWDSSVGVLMNGCAKVVADGAANELLSNQIPVSPEENLSFSVQVKWSGLAYTGSSPILIGITKYFRDPITRSMNDVGSEDLESIVAPASSGGWQIMDFDYQVPLAEDEQIDEIRFRFKLAGTVTAGTVWWDDGSVIKPETGTIDSIVTGLRGWDGTGFTHQSVLEALQAHVSSVLSNTTQIEKLWARVNTVATPAAVTSADDFERSIGSMGSNWSVVGSWAVDGHSAYHTSSFGGGNAESTCRWIGTGATSTNDYQTVSVVLSSSPTREAFYGYDGANYVLGRCNTAMTSYVRFRVHADRSWALDYTTTGSSFTTLTSGTLATLPTSGSVLSLVCGNKATSTTRYYICKVGTIVIADGTYSDIGSNVGASYRSWGFGGRAEGGIFSSQYTPGSVNQWTGQDSQ